MTPQSQAAVRARQKVEIRQTATHQRTRYPPLLLPCRRQNPLRLAVAMVHLLRWGIQRRSHGNQKVSSEYTIREFRGKRVYLVTVVSI